MAPQNRPRPGMGRRQFLRLAAGSAAALAVQGCGGGNGGGPVPPGGKTISDSARLAAVDAVRNFVQTVSLTDIEAAKQQVLDFIRARTEFNSAGLTQGGVWAVFVDGHPFQVILNRVPAAGENSGPDSGRSAASRGTEVPSGSLAARLVNSMGPGFRNEANLLAPSVGKKDYVLQNLPGDIENLRNLGRPAFFYLSAHGDETKVPVIRNNQYVTDAQGNIQMESAFGVSTSTPYDAAAQVRYRAEILRCEVTAAVCVEDLVGGKAVFANRLVITTRWVKANWKFSKNSLIWISACSSDSALAQGFVQACLAGADNAALYVGWSDWAEGEHAVQVSKFVVDRLLGANKLSPLENPAQRPFDFVQVYQDLRSRGLHARPTKSPQTLAPIPGRTTEIIFTQGTASKFGLLAPSISYVLVNEPGGQAILKGIFGLPPANERAVLIGGLEAEVESWAEDKIVCKLPLSGTGSAGDVVVVVRAHKSNVRRITEWVIPMRYRWIDDRVPLVVRGDFTMRFRADVGSYRTKPGEAPRKPVRTAIATADSEGAPAASGQAADGDCTITWSGSVTLRSPHKTPAPTDIVTAMLELNTDSGSGLMGFAFGSLDPLWFTEKTVCPDDPPREFKFAVAALTHSPHEFADPTESGHPALPLLSMPLSFQPNFTLAAGVVEEVEPHIRWEWDAVTPKFPPLADAERSVPA